MMGTMSHERYAGDTIHIGLDDDPDDDVHCESICHQVDDSRPRLTCNGIVKFSGRMVHPKLKS